MTDGVSHELRCADCIAPAVASMGGIPGSPTDGFPQRSVCFTHGRELLRSLHDMLYEYQRAAEEGRPDVE